MRSRMVLAGRFEVFEDGTVNRISNGVSEPAKQSYTGKGMRYATVSYSENGKQYHAYVHRLVETAFIPNPKHLPQVNHKDGNPRNNTVENLEWVTQAQNTCHAYEHGLANPMATAVPCSICGAFTKSAKGICVACQNHLKTEAKEIDKQATLWDRYGSLDTSLMSPTEATYVQLRAKGLSVSEIADRYGVSRQCVSAAILYAEKRARDPSKMSKAQQSALISARKKVQRTKHKVEELEAALLAAKENYAGAQKALKVLEDSSVGSSYLTPQLNNTTLSVR